jgi:hypothetical protein
MKKFLLIFFMLYISSTSLFAQIDICNCIPNTDIPDQHRGNVKHERNFGNFPMRVDTIFPKTIYKWERKYIRKTNTISLYGELSKRKHGTPEDSLYILKGFMYFVKREPDCDFHIEIGPEDTNATRIVIEVPIENCRLQKKIFHIVDSHDGFIMGINTFNKWKAHLKNPIPCVVIGLGFYDKSHRPNTNHGDEHTKKYSWELHPVKDIFFPED